MNGQIQYDPARMLTEETTRIPEDLACRLGRFRHEFLEIGPHPTREELQRLLRRARELALDDREISDERAEILVALEAIDFADRVTREGLPETAALNPLPPDQRCHFVTPVRFGRRRSDQFGHLEMTSTSLRFHGVLDISVVWAEVAGVDRSGHDINVSLVDSRRVLRFCCHSLNEAARGAVVARHLASGSTVAAASDAGVTLRSDGLGRSLQSPASKGLPPASVP